MRHRCHVSECHLRSLSAPLGKMSVFELPHFYTSQRHCRNVPHTRSFKFGIFIFGICFLFEHNSKCTCFTRWHKSRFSTGVVDNSIIVLTKKKLDSFLSYQLVEADLLVCMSARGDRIKMRFNESDKTLRAYIDFQQHPKIQKLIKSNKFQKKQVPSVIKSMN